MQKNIFIQFLCICVILFAVLTVFFSLSHTKRIANQISDEAQQIPTMPSSSLSFEYNSSKSHHILKSQTFISDKTVEEVYQFYDAELKKLGWEFIEEKPLLIWGQDYGSKCVFYVKDGLSLEISYMGNAPDYSGDYGIDIYWTNNPGSYGCP